MIVQCKFLKCSSRTRASTSPRYRNYDLFRVKGCKKKTTRPNVFGPYRLETGHSINQTKAIDRRSTLCHFFNELSHLRPLLSTIQANVGPIAALNKDGLTFTYRMFGALGRVSDQKTNVTLHSKAFVPGICDVYIRRAAQISEHRGAQS